ncbi:SDR family oxidoreductase [Mycolicibacterium sp. 018/SC-01/001]|uniref:SDR family NAD(P)-dependent oxidoreductase n=1 Tax=Mycolicibacterium sp. 018/SC-01/001 TaxID=2592069 RepID=UPI0011817632|nr:SDR family NAD(P)-dependent oxidoreductase [Mycolicibacterium sp. 018/SC-01/001]TRW89009.1 SDR family oxidoreductase [Mycolicibacterium sp. 018/SC-01/001]
MTDLTGRTVVVTGAARGVGKGIATALVARGASVLLADREETLLRATAAELSGGSVSALTVDLRDPDAARRIVAAAVESFGTVHGLVNNAIATNEPKPFHEITAEDYDLVFDVGPRATFALMQAVYPVFVDNGGGSIVNLGSGSGTQGLPRFGAYGAAKEAIRGMSKVAALEWGRHRIRVNVVCPYAETESIRAWREMDPTTYERTVRAVPLGRLGDVTTDVGAVVCFLLGDDAAFVTGQTLMADGGAAGFR